MVGCAVLSVVLFQQVDFYGIVRSVCWFYVLYECWWHVWCRQPCLQSGCMYICFTEAWVWYGCLIICCFQFTRENCLAETILRLALCGHWYFESLVLPRFCRRWLKVATRNSKKYNKKRAFVLLYLQKLYPMMVFDYIMTLKYLFGCRFIYIFAVAYTEWCIYWVCASKMIDGLMGLRAPFY